MEKKEHMKNKINFEEKWADIIYGIMMTGVILICIFCSGMDFGRSEYCQNFLSPLILIVAGIIFVGVVYILCNKLKRPAGWKKNNILIIASAVVFLAQIYSVRLYYFYTDWDVPELLNLADAIVHGGDVSAFADYYSKFTNNLFTAYVFSLIRRVIHMAGFHGYEVYGILCFQCLMNTVTGFLVFKILERLIGDTRLSVMGYVMYLLLIGISPWVSIPYSDSMGLIFPTLIVYIYVNKDRLKTVAFPWLMMSALAVIGYKIKPQTFIAFIAIIIVEVFNLLRDRDFKTAIKKLAGIVTGAVLALMVCSLAVSSTNLEIDREKTFNVQHYIMLGLNDETGGTYSRDDANFSGSFDTAQERNTADMEVAVSRIQRLGALGLIKLAVKKTLTNYYNGTFCWGGEGNFFVGIMEERNLPFSSFVRGLYYSGDYSDVGKYYDIWSNFEQMIWLTILLVSIFSVFADKGSDKAVITLSVIGLTVFELIFEARARYLYTYAPFYIILAVYGISYIAKNIISKSK
jgi:hypothetical protein